MADIYPHTIFFIFQNEVVASIYCNIRKCDESDEYDSYEVWKVRTQHIHRLQVSKCTNKVVCTCLMMEHKGIPCRHILTFLKFNGMTIIPYCYK